MIPTAGSEKRRWEIKIPRKDIMRFEELQKITDGESSYTCSADTEKYWLVCYASAELKLIAKLSIDVEEVGMGIDIQL